MGHHQKVCKNNTQQTNAAQVANQEDEEQLFAAICLATSCLRDKWLIDNSCTNHMIFDSDLFKELNTSVISKVQVGNRDYISTEDKGTVEMKMLLSHSMLSVGQMLENGFKLLFESNYCHIKDKDGRNLFKVMMKGRSFILDLLDHENKSYSVTKINAQVLHKRLRHFNHAAVINSQKKDLVRGLPNLEAEIPDYRTCQFGKQARLYFKKATWRATENLKLIHTDLTGPHQTPALKGSYLPNGALRRANPD
ncbi:hypothetical protein FXO38_09144 [Capsicum annuum]|nr:hypothetical protein FXO38_09144 [Capsicum annuum]